MVKFTAAISENSVNACLSKKCPSLLLLAKYATVITIHSGAKYLHWYNSAVKVSTGDLQWHIALGFLPDGVTINARWIVVNTDGGARKGKQTRQCAACQKGRAPKLLSIGPKGGKKKQILGVELQFTVQSVKLHQSNNSERTKVSDRSCRWELLSHSWLYIGQLHLLQVSAL